MNSNRKSDLIIYALLFLFLLFVRFPSFFYSVFDWDESSMIIMGQNILDGNIPYVAAWDHKPPGIFYIYALFILFFGKSIAAIRLGAIYCIFIASVLLYRTGETLQGRTAGLISAVFLIVFVTSRRWGLSTMPEHIMLVPISLVLYILLTEKINNIFALILGVVLGTGILLKTTMVFESLAVFIILLFGFIEPDMRFSERIKRCIVLVSGIFIPIIFMLCYYFVNDELSVYLKTNFFMAVEYVGGVSIQKKLVIFLDSIKSDISGGNILIWVSFLLGMLYIFFSRRMDDKYKRFLAVAFIIYSLQMFLVFFSGSGSGYHYLILTIPVMSLVSGTVFGIWLTRGHTYKTILNSAVLLVIVIGLLYPLNELIGEKYRQVASRLVNGRQPLMDDTCYKIAGFLEDRGVENQYIYMLNECHIVYWLTGSRYPTRYIHPSNIFKREYMLKIIDGPGTTKEGELQKILSRKPAFIVYKQKGWPQPKGEFKDILMKELKEKYTLVKVIDKYSKIYERKK
jgi:4-amino-4-deoxy-L-arabinose transferase-like glycosyltransferase